MASLNQDFADGQTPFSSLEELAYPKAIERNNGSVHPNLDPKFVEQIVGAVLTALTDGSNDRNDLIVTNCECPLRLSDSQFGEIAQVIIESLREANTRADQSVVECSLAKIFNRAANIEHGEPQKFYSGNVPANYELPGLLETKSLRLGVFGPGNVGKTSFIEWLAKKLEEQNLPTFVVDTDPNESLTIKLTKKWGEEAPAKLLSESPTRKEIKRFFEQPLRTTVAGPSLSIPIEKVPEGIISWHGDNGLARFYRLGSESDPGCAHAKLNAGQTFLANLDLSKFVTVVDHPGGLESLNWGWAATYLDAAIFLVEKGNSKHQCERGQMVQLADEYGLPHFVIEVAKTNDLTQAILYSKPRKNIEMWVPQSEAELLVDFMKGSVDPSGVVRQERNSGLNLS